MFGGRHYCGLRLDAVPLATPVTRRLRTSRRTLAGNDGIGRLGALMLMILATSCPVRATRLLPILAVLLSLLVPSESVAFIRRDLPADASLFAQDTETCRNVPVDNSDPTGLEDGTFVSNWSPDNPAITVVNRHRSWWSMVWNDVGSDYTVTPSGDTYHSADGVNYVRTEQNGWRRYQANNGVYNSQFAKDLAVANQGYAKLTRTIVASSVGAGAAPLAVAGGAGLLGTSFLSASAYSATYESSGIPGGDGSAERYTSSTAYGTAGGVVLGKGAQVIGEYVPRALQGLKNASSDIQEWYARQPISSEAGFLRIRVLDKAAETPITDAARLLPAGRADPFHHIFPRRADLAAEFSKRGVVIDKFTMQLPRDLHIDLHRGAARGGQWNKAWEDFFKTNPNATDVDIYKNAGKLIHDFEVPGGGVGSYPR